MLKAGDHHTNDNDSMSNHSHVMISYAHKNRPLCDKLYEILSKYLHCWRDVEQMPGASDLWSCIADAIVRADFVVALLSPDYEASESCKNEFAFALNRGILFIPIFISQQYMPAHTIDIRIIRLLHFFLDDIFENPSILYSHIVRLWMNHRGKSTVCRAFKPELSLNDFMASSSTNKQTAVNSHVKLEDDNANESEYVSIGKVLSNSSSNLPEATEQVKIEVHDGPNFEMDNCEYKTEGKPVKLNNLLYSSNDGAEKQAKTPTSVYKLLFRNEEVKCIEIIDEKTILLVNKTNEFYMIVQNSKDPSSFQHLKMTKKQQHQADNCVVDMAFDTQSSLLYVLNKLNIEIYKLKMNELQLELLSPLAIPHKQPYRYSRIYMSNVDESAFILIDRLNSRIYWHYKQTCAKKRCIKAINGSIAEPRSFLGTKSSIYIVSRAGLLVCTPDSTILHSSLSNIVDIAYDHEHDCIYFIDSTSLFFINLSSSDGYQVVFKKYRKLISITKFNDTSKYKEFKRITINQKYIYLLTSSSKASDCSAIFAIERKP